MRPPRLVVTEGLLEVTVAEKILTELGTPTTGVRFLPKGGRKAFWRDARRYNRAAFRCGPVIGLADLERFPCPSGLIMEHLPEGRNTLFALRVAERMLESWLLADAEALAMFLGVSPSSFPRDPDAELNPKRTLANLARHSSATAIRRDIVPEEGSKGVIGGGYRPRIAEFVKRHWRPFEAAKHSESLRRAIAAIRQVCSS